MIYRYTNMLEHNIWYVKQKLSRVGKPPGKSGVQGGMVISAEGRRHGLKKLERRRIGTTGRSLPHQGKPLRFTRGFAMARSPLGVEKYICRRISPLFASLPFMSRASERHAKSPLIRYLTVGLFFNIGRTPEIAAA